MEPGTVCQVCGGEREAPSRPAGRCTCSDHDREHGPDVHAERLTWKEIAVFLILFGIIASAMAVWTFHDEIFGKDIDDGSEDEDPDASDKASLAWTPADGGLPEAVIPGQPAAGPSGAAI